MKSSKLINKLLDNYLYNVCATLHTKKSGITAVELCPFVSSTEDIVLQLQGVLSELLNDYIYTTTYWTY
jgi:hypothetical protein